MPTRSAPRARIMRISAGGDAEPLVQMDAAEKDERTLAGDRHRSDRPAVPDGARSHESGQVVKGDLVVGRTQAVGRVGPARTEDERDVVTLDPGGPRDG